MTRPALVGAVGLAGAGLLHFHDPHSGGAYGYCPFLLITGRPCPGCGGLRAINDLTRFDFGAAVSSNILAVALAVVLVVAFVRWIPHRWRGEEMRMIVLSPRAGVAVLVLMFAFGVVRNTPWGRWLAP
ncbi:MAG: DUF2752 domain-containing protein [Aeromicrobium sp.]